MLLNQLRYLPSYIHSGFGQSQQRLVSLGNIRLQSLNAQEVQALASKIENEEPTGLTSTNANVGAMCPAPRVVPMVLSKEPIVLPFNEVPGPKSLKYLSNFRQYLSEIGTQLTAGFLTFGLNIGTLMSTKRPLTNISALFDEYGPVVRFISPVGGDIVLINHPEHIQKVYTMEGDLPVRSSLDSLEKYRMQHRNHLFSGMYSVHGNEWSRQRSLVYDPLHNSIAQHLHGIYDTSENLTRKLYNIRNHQDEIPKDLYSEIHKWAFDCMGLLIFSKKFTMLDTELIYNQCDMSWLYHSLEKATDAIVRCESGLHLWKLFPTPAWRSLVKYCDNMDNLIGKHVMEAEQGISLKSEGDIFHKGANGLIISMLMGEQKMSPEDISTVLMDMLLIGVNTITSSMSFLLYYLAKYQRVQKILHKEIDAASSSIDISSISKIKENTPYLQACIKETLRLVPPIPILTRILPKNITLDKYNIPRGTLIIMSTQDASQRESNYDDAFNFIPERWLKPEAQEYHAFASIPFGYGARKCLGQNIAETMMSVLTMQIMQKYKLEYHYGDIRPTRSFIAKPNKPLKIRFIDRNL